MLRTSSRKPGFPQHTTVSDVKPGTRLDMDLRNAQSFVQQLSSNLDNAHFRFTAVTVVRRSDNGAMKAQIVIQGERRRGSLLLKLPVELRERIYGYVFARNEDITIIAFTGRKPANDTKLVSGWDFRTASAHKGQEWDDSKGKWLGGPPSELSLLLANKQIHAEATPAAYRLNRFDFPQYPSTRVPQFIKLIGTSVQHLSVVKLGQMNIQGFKAILKALKGATGLYRLQIRSHNLIILHIRNKAKVPDDPVSWACAFNRLVSNFLLDLQKAYKASNRSWKAVEVVHIERAGWLSSPNSNPNFARSTRLQLDLFEKTFKEITAGYLEA